MRTISASVYEALRTVHGWRRETDPVKAAPMEHLEAARAADVIAGHGNWRGRKFMGRMACSFSPGGRLTGLVFTGKRWRGGRNESRWELGGSKRRLYKRRGPLAAA